MRAWVVNCQQYQVDYHTIRSQMADDLRQIEGEGQQVKSTGPSRLQLSGLGGPGVGPSMGVGELAAPSLHPHAASHADRPS